MDKQPGMVKITATEHNIEKIMKKKKKESSLRDHWANTKHTNILIIGAPEREEREKGPPKILQEIIVENFPNMGKETVNQVQEVQRVPGRINPRIFQFSA